MSRKRTKRPRWMRRRAAEAAAIERNEQRTFQDLVDLSEGTIRSDGWIASLSVAAKARKALDVHIQATPAFQPACRAGCDFCCHVRVAASIPEVLLIAARITSEWEEEEIKAVRARIAAHRRRTATLAPAQRYVTRVTCPLLKEGRCSVYKERPLTCRGWHSFDVEACRQDFEHPAPPGKGAPIPRDARVGFMAQTVLMGVNEGAHRAGLESYAVELVAALEIALNNPLLRMMKWMHGKPVFAAAYSAEYEKWIERERGESDASSV